MIPSPDARGVHHPADESEVAELVRAAAAAGRTVRVVGAAHSEAPAIGARGALLISLDRLDRIAIDPDRRTARVGGGARFGPDPRDPLRAAHRERGLCHALARHGLALPSLGGVSHQTVAGFLSTGSQGACFDASLAQQVLGLRLVDGLGRTWALSPDEEPDLFRAAGCALGLLGVIVEVTFACIPDYEVEGDEGPRKEACLDDPVALLSEADFTRALWFPQPGVRRLSLWRARRVRQRDGLALPRAERDPEDVYLTFPKVAGSMVPAQVGAALGLSALEAWPKWLDRRLPGLRARAYGPFAPPLDAPPKSFRGRWDRAIAMDDGVSERIVPTRFCELWFARDEAAAALATLRDYTARGGWSASGTFAWEVYPAGESPFDLAPGGDRGSVRVNVFWYGRNRSDPHDLFDPLIEVAAPHTPRLHWGKILCGRPDQTLALARRAYPRFADFRRARAALDPEHRFVSPYWRAHLGLEAPPTPATALAPPAPPSAEPVAERAPPVPWRAPLPFGLRPSDATLLDRTPHVLEFRAVLDAPPTFAFDALVEPADAGPWMPAFWGAEHLSGVPSGRGVVFDEHFAFLRLRLRTVEHVPGARWVASIERTSLPLASEMVEVLEMAPFEDRRTVMRWRIGYVPLAAVAPLHPVVQPLFRRFFAAIVDGLKRHCRAHGAAPAATR